jgi:hypothetical protein
MVCLTETRKSVFPSAGELYRLLYRGSGVSEDKKEVSNTSSQTYHPRDSDSPCIKKASCLFKCGTPQKLLPKAVERTRSFLLGALHCGSREGKVRHTRRAEGPINATVTSLVEETAEMPIFHVSGQ